MNNTDMETFSQLTPKAWYLMETVWLWGRALKSISMYLQKGATDWILFTLVSWDPSRLNYFSKSRKTISNQKESGLKHKSSSIFLMLFWRCLVIKFGLSIKSLWEQHHCSMTTRHRNLLIFLLKHRKKQQKLLKIQFKKMNLKNLWNNRKSQTKYWKSKANKRRRNQNTDQNMNVYKKVILLSTPDFLFIYQSVYVCRSNWDP